MGPAHSDVPSLDPLEPSSSLRLPKGTIYLPGCWLAHNGLYRSLRGVTEMPPCNGRLIRAHLLPQRLLRRFVPPEELWAPGTWVWACGGIVGNAGHHGAFDMSRTIRVPRKALPEETEKFARAWGLEWYLAREYK